MAMFVALLRGINVGTAKQVPMAQLAQVVENLGGRAVATVLRSGNVVFSTEEPPDAAEIETELHRVTGVRANVLLLLAADFVAVVEANPLAGIATNGSRFFTTFLSEPPPEIELPDAAALAPEQIVLGARAVYQWFPDGSMQTKVPKSFWTAFGGVLTAHNANTVQKIMTLLKKNA